MTSNRDNGTFPFEPYIEGAPFNFNSIYINELDPLNTIYHYTGPAGVRGILESQSLRASSLSMLNDTGEFSYGADFIASRWEQVREHPGFQGWVGVMNRFLAYMRSAVDSARDYYVCCASTAKDNLSQFRLYGPYILDIDAQTFLHSPSEPAERLASGSVEASTRDTSYQWRRVRYSRADQTHLADITIDRLFFSLTMLLGDPQEEVDFANLYDLSRAIEAYAEGACYIKHEAFADEQEARFLMKMDIRDDRIRFRDGTYGLTPYIELVADGELNATNGRTQMLIGVGLGPVNSLSDKQTALFGLRALLRHLAISFQARDVLTPLR